MTSLGDICSLVNGELVGDPSYEITGVAALEDAKQGQLSFVLDTANLLAASSSPASAFIVPQSVESFGKPIIKADNPRLALAKVLNYFTPVEEITPGVDPRAHIGKDVILGHRVLIYPFSYIGDGSIIGDDTIIHPNVTIYPRTHIGKRCIIHSGTVIGVDGFGFVMDNGHFVKIPQIGRVIIEDDVEIYANNCIARGTIGDTVIKSGTKIDDLNHFAHNVKIGSDCGITVMNAFGGSSSIGNRVQMSSQAGITPHTHVGDESIIMAKTGITKNFPARSVLLGFPAQDHQKETRLNAFIRRLPDLFEKVKNLENRKKTK